MSLEENKAIARRLTDEGENNQDLDALDEMVAPDYILHGMPPEYPSGLEGLKLVLKNTFKGFPDWKITIHDLFAEGDRVAERWSAVGTHLGEWEGIAPTGKKVYWDGILIYRIVDGKVTEEWVVDNTSSILQELAEGSSISY